MFADFALQASRAASRTELAGTARQFAYIRRSENAPETDPTHTHTQPPLGKRRLQNTARARELDVVECRVHDGGTNAIAGMFLGFHLSGEEGAICWPYGSVWRL